MAYCAVTFLVHRLSRLIDEEPHFFRGVELVQAISIRTELSWMMHNCVEYFDKERDEHKRVEQYRRQIRDIVFDVEDAIDMLMLKGATAKRRQIEVVIKAKVLDDVVKKIKGIKVGIEEMATNIEKLSIEGGAASHVDPTAEETRQRRKRDVEEDDVVGFVKHFAALADWLTKGIPNLGVIPIVGRSGLGKTTIARKLYNSDSIKTHFKCRVWVPLSRFSAAEEVLLNILEEMPITLELGRTLNKTPKELHEKLSTYLLEKRYLVVLDGIPSLQLWEEVRSAFPDTLNGSRILITTRTVNVSPPPAFAYTYSLPFLNKDESWELFHKKAFRGGECPPVLETLGKQTIEYCWGLPFAIVVLGSCLANIEKTYEAWSKVLDEIKHWNVFLTLIYSHLPQHLKPCLLHLKKYEEGLEIPVEFLIQEWISLGFIERSGERNTGDVARDYFKELVERSLIQVVSRRSDGEATICSIHDLVRKLCISKYFTTGRAKTTKGKNKAKAMTSAKYPRTLLNRDTNMGASIQVISSRFFRSEVVTLLKQLIEENSKLDVISITGMGGLGKTTLAREIYNNDAIKSRFNFRAWMTVSQNFRTRELLLQILKCQMPKSDVLIRSLEDMSRDELKKKLLEYLRGKRYLIVMDDVWITEIWDEIRSAFPDDFNGSRILITSRMQEVASHTSLNPPYSLPFIKEDESWNLFREMVLPGGYPKKFLADLGKQIAQGCLGIPLSIVVLFGVLANKGKTHRIWSKVIADVNWYPAQATTLRDDILNLSYTHLPRNLKPCFLYLGAYPKDFEIPASQLIHLWIAEGLINCGSNEDIEDVAENYLKELIARNLIQVVERRSDGGAKTCHVHDLLQDLCISKGAEEKFFDVPNVNLSSWKKSRRLSIQGSTLDLYMSSNTPSPSIARSLLFFGEDTYGGFDPNHWKWVEENFNLLRVLNFGNLNVYSIPTWIKRLIHLRYLRVQSDALKVIPASIGNLTNLETLDLRGTFLNSLPIGIWKLRNLRNLYMSGPVSLPNQSDTEIKALSNLQVLSTVSLDTQTVRPIVEAKLPNLRKLGIWFASNESNSEAGHALASLQHLHRLRKLKIINCSEILSLPNSFPETIRKITLRQVCLEDSDCMKVLGNLVNLQILKLQSCLLSSQLYIFGDSFPALIFLKLENLRIEEWKQGSRAMRKLRHLVIDRCFELNILPWELCNMINLREVEVLESKFLSVKVLQELQRKAEIKVLIDPPLDDFPREFILDPLLDVFPGESAN